MQDLPDNPSSMIKRWTRTDAIKNELKRREKKFGLRDLERQITTSDTSVLDTAYTDLDYVELKDSGHFLEKILSALTPQEKKVILMKFVRWMSNTEIARELNVTLQAVSARD